MYSYQKAYRLYPHGQNLLLARAMVGPIQNVDPIRVKLLVDPGATFTMLPVQTLSLLIHSSVREPKNPVS